MAGGMTGSQVHTGCMLSRGMVKLNACREHDVSSMPANCCACMHTRHTLRQQVSLPLVYAPASPRRQRLQTARLRSRRRANHAPQGRTAANCPARYLGASKATCSMPYDQFEFGAASLFVKNSPGARTVWRLERA